MKKQSQKIYLMLALIPLGACADHEEMCTEAKAGRVIFEMTTTDGASSRTQTDKTGITTFVGGDEVGIFATKLAGKVTEDLAVNSLYKSVALDDGSLTWGSMDADKMVQATSFYAYYPYNAKDTLRSAIVHTVSTDQGEEEAYNKSDLLTAVKTNVPASIPGERVIKLDFEHKLAMVQVELTGPGVKAAPADFRLINVQPTATINFDKKPGDPQFVTTSGEATTVRMLKVSERIAEEGLDNRVLYRAVVPAQTLKANSSLLHFSIGGFVYAPMHSKDLSLKAGAKLNLVVKLGDKGAALLVKDNGITQWEEDTDDPLNGEAQNGGAAMPLVPQFPAISAETKLPEAVTDYPQNGYTGWWFQIDAGKKGISFKEEEKPHIEVQLDDKASLSYWLGPCAVAGSMKYRLSFDYKGGKVKEFTGVAVIDRRNGENYCFRPIGAVAGSAAAGALSAEVINGISNAVMVPYAAEWSHFSYDFDLSKSGLTTGKFTLHPGSRELNNPAVIVAGRVGTWTTMSVANIKFEPIP